MTTQTVIDFEVAAARRDAGMKSSFDHANDDHPHWGEHCYDLLCRYADLRMKPWTCEEFRGWAYEQGLEKPAEERAFGAVTSKAIRRGVITPVGMARTASSNNGFKATYIKPEAA